MAPTYCEALSASPGDVVVGVGAAGDGSTSFAGLVVALNRLTRYLFSLFDQKWKICG